MDSIPNFSYQKIASVCREHGVAKLSVFGSALTPKFHEKSDFDILVDFKKSIKPSMFSLVRLKDDLDKALGRNVDLVTTGSLSPLLKDKILKSARPAYEETDIN